MADIKPNALANLFCLGNEDIPVKHGQLAQGQDNINCLQLGINVNNEKKYIKKVVYVDKNGYARAISRRLINKLINPADASNIDIINSSDNAAQIIAQSMSSTLNSNYLGEWPEPELQVSYKGYTAYGISNIANSGCSIVSTAMIYSYILNKKVTVQEIADRTKQLQISLTAGTSEANFKKFASSFGITFNSCSYDASISNIKKWLKQGKVINISTTDSFWTNRSHQIGIIALDSTEKYVYTVNSSSGKPEIGPDAGSAMEGGSHNGWYKIDRFSKCLSARIYEANGRQTYNYAINNYNLSKVWMGWIPFESGHAYGTKEALARVSTSDQGDCAYGEFQFDYSCSDLYTLIQRCVAAGFKQFNSFLKYTTPNPDFGPKGKEKNNLKIALQQAADKNSQLLNAIQTRLNAENYLTGGDGNVLKLCNDYKFDWTKQYSQGDESARITAAFIGALWSFSNRCGGGKYLISSVEEMAKKQQQLKNDLSLSSAISIIEAGYNAQNKAHIYEKSRWNTSLQNYNSEYYAIVNYIKGTASSIYSKVEDIQTVVVNSTSQQLQDFVIGPCIMSNESYDFGLIGNKNFSITCSFSSQKANGTINILANGITSYEDNFEIIKTESLVGPYWMLYALDGFIHFRMSNIINTYDYNTGIKVNTSFNFISPVANKNTITIDKKVIDGLYEFSFKLNGNLKYTTPRISLLDESFCLPYGDEAIAMWLGGKLDIPGIKSKDDDKIYFTGDIIINGESSIHDVQNTYKFIISSIYNNQNLESIV